MSEPGDNQLKSIVSRINTLMDERKTISDDIADVFTLKPRATATTCRLCAQS
jgi:uncharacterized protein (UPF0335 family)